MLVEPWQNSFSRFADQWQDPKCCTGCVPYTLALPASLVTWVIDHRKEVSKSHSISTATVWASFSEQSGLVIVVFWRISLVLFLFFLHLSTETFSFLFVCSSLSLIDIVNWGYRFWNWGHGMNVNFQVVKCLSWLQQTSGIAHHWRSLGLLLQF